jgi:rod shape-determining protein MreD
MDIHEGALLGEHALLYSLLCWGAIALHRRVPWFGIAGRMLHLLPLLLSAQLLALLARGRARRDPAAVNIPGRPP